MTSAFPTRVQTVYFEFETREETPRIAAPEEFGELFGASTIMDHRDRIDIVIDYPLTNPTTLHMDKPITVERFARGVAAAYKVIYATEDRDGTIYGKQTDTTEGLYLEAATLKHDGKWHLIVGS